MKINESNRIGATGFYNKQREFQAESANNTKKRDQVQISAAAKEMLTTSKLNAANRGEQLDRLKQSVAAGAYFVDAGKIAEKLLPYMKE